MSALALAAFDESGKLDDTEYVVFGGSVATPESWYVLSEKWNQALHSEGISFFSMKDALYSHGPFAGWKGQEERRDALLLKLAEIAQPLVAFHVTMPMGTAEFKMLPEATRRSLKNPQYCGFEGCMRGVVSGVKNPHMKIALYCDSSYDYSVECLKLYLRMRSHDQEFKRRVVSLTFAEDEHYPPLQLADMVASCARQDYTRTTVKPPKVIDDILKVFNRDGAMNGSFSYVVNGPGLGHGFLEEPVD